jgi:hypothetical protein
MAILTTAVTYGGKQATEGLTAGLIFNPVLAATDFAQLAYDVREDVQGTEHMYKIVPSDKVTRKATTCGWNPYGKLGDLIDETISVVKLKVEMEQCAMDFDGKILQAMKKRGWDRENLEGTEFARLLEDIAQPIIARDLRRIISLGDTANASADYNMIDGKWKKIMAAVGASTIAKTADLPDTGAVTPAQANTALLGVHFGAPIELQSTPANETIKVVTRSVYNAYLQYLSSNNALESSWQLAQNGTKTLMHFGVEVVPEDEVDRYVAADFAGANPHRIYYTAKNNITIATDLESDFTTIRFWYEEKEEMNLMRVSYKLGVSLGWGQLFSVAY